MATGGTSAGGGADVAVGTGGAQPAGGVDGAGAAPAAGGSGAVTAASGSGAAPAATGGVAGGTPAGGGATGTGGAVASGGTPAGGGQAATGGLSSTGGSSSTGGAVATGGADGTGGASNAEAATLISGWLDTLQWGAPTGDTKTQIVDAIVKTCEQFGPTPSGEWKTEYCWAHLAAGILKESSYDPTSSRLDDYGKRSIDGVGTANDPTVGLLQVRFSSTLHDFALFGPLDALQAIGCDFPTALTDHANDSGWGNSEFWAVTGPTEYASVMTSIPCNVALGAWYYYIYATGSGYGNCNSDGTGDTFAAGLLSHLNGPSGAHNTDQNSASYVSEITQRMESFLGTTIPDPYSLALQPEKQRYCR